MWPFSTSTSAASAWTPWRKRYRGTPIVFITGYGKTAASGLVLEKPYDAAALERYLTKAWGTTRENAKR
jgi:adenylosuccinate lyase